MLQKKIEIIQGDITLLEAVF